MSRRIILPNGAPKPVSYYSHGIRVGPYLYSAGQTARDQSGQIIGVGDAELQAERSFSNLMLVLEDAEMSPNDVVRLNIFIRNASDLPKIIAVRDRVFDAHKPALTVAVVESLAYEEYLLEVEAIATADEAK